MSNLSGTSPHACQLSGFRNSELNDLFVVRRGQLVGDVETYWSLKADLFMYFQPARRIWAITPRWTSQNGQTVDLWAEAQKGQNVACAYQIRRDSVQWHEWCDSDWQVAEPTIQRLYAEGKQAIHCKPEVSSAVKSNIGVQQCQTEDMRAKLTPSRVATESDEVKLLEPRSPSPMPPPACGLMDSAAPTAAPSSPSELKNEGSLKTNDQDYEGATFQWSHDGSTKHQDGEHDKKSRVCHIFIMAPVAWRL
jgi:hypothetical protein